MVDESTTDSTIDNVSDLSAEPVAVAPSTEKNKESELVSAQAGAPHSDVSVEKNTNTPEREQDKPSATPPANPQPFQETRKEPRIRVKWYADAIIDGVGAYRGFLKDISLNGTDLFLDSNLQHVKVMKLRIYVPPLSKSSEPRAMEVTGKVVYTIYDGNESLFHTGLNFSQFNSESDQAYLKSRITSIVRE